MNQTENNKQGSKRFVWIWGTGILAFLILLAAVSLPFAKNYYAIKELDSVAGFYMETEFGFPLNRLPDDWQSWLQESLGEDISRPFMTVTILRQGYIDSYLYDNNDLAILGNFPVFTNLDLSGSPVTDTGLSHLKEHTNLHSLSLVGTQVTDAGLVHLRKLTNLETLMLARSQVSDSGLVHLKGLTNLSYLILSGTQVTDADLIHLNGLANLELLYLVSTQVTDAGLIHLNGLTNLDSLYLNDTQVSDAGLVHLEGLTELDSLYLYYTQVTAKGVSRLKLKLPDCDIKY